MAEQYKIELGVKLRDGAIQNEINEAQKTLKPIELKVDAETKELTNTIREALNSLSKGTKNALTIDTSKIEASLDKLSSVVADIKTSLGTLDSKSGMKDLLSSINQMTAALGKAENESDSLVKSLSALAKKDFSLNIGVKLGGSNSVSNSADYGEYLRSTVIPELQKQEKALAQYLAKYYNTNELSAISSLLTKAGHNMNVGDVWATLDKLNSPIKKGEIGLRAQELRDYINLIQQAASMVNVDLAPVTTGFSGSANDLVQQAKDIRDGTTKAKESVSEFEDVLKRAFGSGVSSEQLDSIVTDLGEIKTAIQGLSQNNVIDGLTQSFNKLSETLDKLMANARLVQDVLGGVGSGVNVGVGNGLERQSQQAQQSAQEIQQAAQQITDAYNKISRDTSLVRDAIPDVDFQQAFEKTNQAAQEAQRHFQELLADEKAVVSVTEQFDDNNALQSFVVNVQRATGEVETLRYAMDKLDDKDNGIFKYQGGSASDSKVEKQLESHIKKANDLQIKLDKIKSGYNNMGTNRPIKDAEHIEALDRQYRKVERAIADVRNADSTAFSSMVSNAEREKTALENMVREFRNIENVATSLRSKDIGTVKSTYSSKLDVLISKMQSSGVYTSGFESGAENLRSILSSATDANGLLKFLNGLDKLEAGYKRVDAAVKEFNRSQKVGINVSGLESKIANIQRISPEIDKFETKIDGANVSVKSLLNDLSQVKTQGDFSVVNSRFKAFADAAEAAGIAVTEVVAKAKTINQIKFELADTGANGLKYQIESIREESKRFVGQSAELREALNHVDIAFNALNTANEVDDTQALSKAYNDLKNALESVNSQLAKNKQIEKEYNSAAKLEQEKNNFSKRMQIWLSQNTAAAKQFGDRIEVIQSQLKSCDKTQLDNLKQEFRGITQEAKLAGKTGQTFLGGIKSQFAKYSQYFSVASLFQYAEQGLRSMFEQVKLIDSAMTELKKVTNETDEAYSKFLKNAATRSREIGTTIDGLVSSTADFARLGYGFEDAQGLAEVANIYAVVGDEIEGVEGATESLISTMAAFKDEMNGMSNTDFAMSIIDKFNEIKFTCLLIQRCICKRWLYRENS